MVQGNRWIRRSAWLVVLAMAATGCSSDDDDGGSAASEDEGDVTLNVATFGGSAGESVRTAFEPFEESTGISITWVEGGASDNVAKAVATKDNPEFDIVMAETNNHHMASGLGIWEPLDPEIVTNLEKVPDNLRIPTEDGVPWAVYASSLFYNTEVFEEEGWEPPTTYEDLFRPEFCGRIAYPDPTVSSALLGATFFADGEPTADSLAAGLERVASLKDCVPEFDASSVSINQKITSGDLAVGLHTTTNLFTLMESGVPVKTVYPPEGVGLSYSTAAAVKGSDHPEEAQKFLNWMLSPEAQDVFVNQRGAGPTIEGISVTDEAIEAGVTDPEMIASGTVIPADVIADERQQLIDDFRRLLEG